MKDWIVKIVGFGLMFFSVYLVGFSNLNLSILLIGAILALTGATMAQGGYSSETINNLDWVARAMGVLAITIGIKTIFQDKTSYTIGGCPIFYRPASFYRGNKTNIVFQEKHEISARTLSRLLTNY